MFRHVSGNTGIFLDLTENRIIDKNVITECDWKFLFISSYITVYYSTALSSSPLHFSLVLIIPSFSFFFSSHQFLQVFHVVSLTRNCGTNIISIYFNLSSSFYRYVCFTSPSSTPLPPLHFRHLFIVSHFQCFRICS